MKKQLLTLLIATTSLSLFGQTAIEIRKAKAACTSYLKRNLNNPGSYSAKSWGKLEKTYIEFEDSSKAKEIDGILETFNKGKDPLWDKLMTAKVRSKGDFNADSTYMYYDNIGKRVIAETDSLTKLRIKLQKSYKPKFDGYSIEHSFRARNRFNAMILQTYVFILNKNFKVTDSADREEMEQRREDLQREIDNLVNGKS